jgi:DNA-binding response OmpR family regulator
VFVAREGDEIQLAATEPVSKREEEEPPAPTTPVRPHVLVVEDDWMVRDLIRDILNAEDYVVDQAGTGREAIARVESHQPDLVLLDMRMPEMDGFEVLRHIRGSQSAAEVPVIMLTASEDQESIEKGFRDGANDYMTKPFTPSQLRARISGWLRRSASGEKTVD